MSYSIEIDHDDKTPKVTQIVQAFKADIEAGHLKQGEALPSINYFAKQHGISRDTIEKAYKRLHIDGYVIATANKGHYVQKIAKLSKSALLIVNKLSEYKKEIYEGFREGLGKDINLDIQIHHYDLNILHEILKKTKGKYHYYAVMPHFYEDAKSQDIEKVLKVVPTDALILLDKDFTVYKHTISVHQDFDADIFEGLSQMDSSLRKYSSLKVIFPADAHHPQEILNGIKKYARKTKLAYKKENNPNLVSLDKGTVFITLQDSDLAVLLKRIRNGNLKLGEDIGVISFNETVLKDLLGITVVTTEFFEMGKTAAKMILDKQKGSFRNPFRVIVRSSV